MKGQFLGVLLMMSASSFAGEIRVKVNGMVCSMCAQGIQKKFKAHSEVQGLSVNLDDKIVEIQTKEGTQISDEQVTKLIQEAGYHVVSIERK